MKLIVCLFGIFCYGECAKILGAFIYPSVSHQSTFQPIWKELSLRGHQVTVITPNPLNDPTLTNLTEIDVSFVYKNPKLRHIINNIKKDDHPLKAHKIIFELFRFIFEEEMQYEPIKRLIENQDKHAYDLLLIQYSYFTDPLLAFLNKFNAPLVGVSSLGLLLHGHDAMGNPTHPVVSPDFMLGLPKRLNIIQKVESLFHNFAYRLFYHWYILPKLDESARKYFGDDMVPLRELHKNVSLVLYNNNRLIHEVRPNVPNVIEINQLHIKKPKPLPEDIQKYLDSSPQGVVYFSFGTNVKSSNLSYTLRKEIIGALAELPYKVIWKWEDDYLPDQPINVLVRKWLPQQDILNHPNVKVFLTQGGLQSIEETINCEVPIVGMPFFTDQPTNIQKIAELGMGLYIEHTTVTKDILKNALLEVAQNKKYKENVVKYKQILVDEPMRGVEKAIWWIEYVMRHNGAAHLRSMAADMTFFEYFMIDVVVFSLIVISLMIYISLKLFSYAKMLLITLSRKLKPARNIVLKIEINKVKKN
ncbi:unnamed protein product [Phyllotreta striolata]|uniref:UDP-glucuronosyltransferase n=1 Tax=Phyllotreta striolata TaxID=444603 RepID=A0A9N9TS60_PHYSR|nr:unnamed protein product [Phyllotreta striolata]